MVIHSIHRTLIVPVFFVLLLSAIPLNTTEAVESNRVFTELAEDYQTTVRFNPNSLHDFELTFTTDTRDHDIHMNYSAVDSGGAFDLANWEIDFDPEDFVVGLNNDIQVTVTISTNLTSADKGRSLVLTVWGDVADDERDDIDTNSQVFIAIIAERDDVELSVDAKNDMKLVYPNRETRFNVFVTNTGWSANSIALTAKVIGVNSAEWTVHVIYASLDGMKSGEVEIGMINVTSPEVIAPGDYSLQIKAKVGDYNNDTIILKARVDLPDFSVSEVTPLYNPVLEGVKVTIKAIIVNNGGYAENILVRGEVEGHNGRPERIPDVTIESITNYNETEAVFTWTALMTDKGNFTETWTIRIRVDYLYSIDETNEDNNQGESITIVRGIEKTSVSFKLTPALMILGVMMVFTGAVGLDRRSSKKKD
jgi:hypothetical protein